ncbi:amidophosphoribosyltransferase [Pseudoramibacter sp.]|jgi:amidophosphoribosyltransferase|uniref:amidophosphoribosyltransferase n=1 Tax=Pseudoramibacter sp. TaxID=2034862 RepID=UPI0025D59167|nr:amidophosphoribosyltransferase [Pseudoramibacter sp.]MCH4072377.1 amidophosphoribosyltransferase [Pseudoramibacter sp.]MCH4106148.1 amidophosphoribosyltransferase [Pseudoramibacter sp.]
MSIHEECGVFGAISPERKDLGRLAYYGLYALQHRGQESCGIVVDDDGLFYSHKDLGLVGDVFSKEDLDRLPDSTMAVGHVRYSTTGEKTRANCQPIEVNHQKGKLALAHNGNLTNSDKLRDRLELSGAIFHTTSDTETIAYIITGKRLHCGSIEDAVSQAMDEIEGAYSLVVMSAAKLMAVRDPYGYRPLCYGKTADGTYIVASESCALQAVGATFIRDLEPGEMLVFSTDGKVESRREHCNKVPRQSCIFEQIYFARPDSVIDGIPIHEARVRAGRALAKAYPVDADAVIGVPDSGLNAAVGYAQESGIPYSIGLIKNKYIARTFISPGQRERDNQVHIKLNPISSIVKGKRIILVDDSIVRGTTSRRLVTMMRDAGATEVHMRISAPPFLHPCYYGVDIDSEDNLIAAHHSVDEICKLIGADSLGYLPIEDLELLSPGVGYCAGCFTGKYATKVSKHYRKDRFSTPLSQRKKKK